MGITKVVVKKYKSIKRLSFDMERDKYKIQCLIGKNGSGKSSFLDAINYFYSMLSGINENTDNIIDTTNRYLQFAEIEIEYDFSELVINNSNIYYDEKMLDLYDFMVDGKIRLRMTQFKDGTLKWYPNEMNDQRRKMIYKLFPIYLIDTRFITLQDWTSLWEIISDISLGKVQLNKQTVEEKMDTVLSEIYGEKYIKSIKMITKVFNSEGIKIDDASYKDKYMNALIMRLGGNDFLSDENRLSYYSDGLNSLKYVKLVVELISELSNTGWKNPLLLLDEPEIGLHSQYIEELVGCFEKNICTRVNMIISTHSPHIVSEMIKNELSIGIWRIFNDSGYARFEKLKDIVDIKQKYLISDIESSCYFSNALLFVEGKSEIQFFKNRRIVQLYPKIEKINIVNYDSDNSSLKLIYPDEMGFSVPHYTVIDMDKILVYSYKTKKFKKKSDSLVNPLYNPIAIKKQKYFFYNENSKKLLTYNLRLHLQKMLSVGTYEQSGTNFYINDYFFEQLLNVLKIYCDNYRVIPLRTTIEGAIINTHNIEVAIEWMKTKLDLKNICKLDTILNKENFDNKKYRATIVRSILNGKFDNLKNYNEKEVHLENVIKSTIDVLRKNFGKKTSGWIGEFIEYYFQNNIDIIISLEEKQKKFKNDFEELDFVLHKSTNMLK